jgi:hypothetical protein
MTFEEKCAKVDEITRAMSGMADRLTKASASDAPFLELVMVGLWQERAALIEQVDKEVIRG